MVLEQRQRDGILPEFPIFGDIRKFDGRPWRGMADIVAGGVPCQNVSVAGDGKGVENGEHSRLWAEMARVVREVRPRYVFVENSPALTTRGLDKILGDLAAMGFDAEWGVFSAISCGAPHERERMFIMAYASGEQLKGPESWSIDIGASKIWPESDEECIEAFENYWQEDQSKIARMVDGMANRMDMLKAIGNGQVPVVVAYAWRLLMERAHA